MATSYEFNELENRTISSTARYARIWGVISLIAGVLLLGMGILMTVVFAAMGAAATASGSTGAFKPAMIAALGAALIPSSIVSIIGGIFYWIAGSSLQRVVDTQGNDIALLMQGVKSLSRAFMIEAIAMMVSFVAGLGIGLAAQLGGH
ncbi:MAG TPA: hypothetical protein VGH28_00420 [Polyangiaceae bacterium]